MELEQPNLQETPSVTSKKPSETFRCSSFSSITNGLCRVSDYFSELEIGLPSSNVTEEKRLAWLRSQIIGHDAEFDSPFGTRRLTYADHTASGRSLHYVENFVLRNVLPFYGNTHTSDSYVGHRTTKMLHEATQYIKSCLGGTANDAIMFCGQGTTSAIKRLQEAMGIAVPSIVRDRVIKCLSNEERWVVFVGPHEHHSNLLSWRQSLAEVIEIGLDEDGLIDLEALRQHLESFKTSNRPILGSFSACSNVTGILLDTRAIAQLLHKYGGFACFDFAASGPYVEIDMKSGEDDGYDAVVLSPHKFLGGPGSPGVLLMNKALYQLKSSAPSTCGGGVVNYVNGFNEKDTLYLDDIEERENGGTPQIIQTIRAALAFWTKEYITHQLIANKEEMYIEEALQRLLPNKNIRVLGNTTADRLAILSFLIYSTKSENTTRDKNDKVLDMWEETANKRDKPLHGPFVAALLNDLFGIQSRGGCACAGPYGHDLLDIDEPFSLSIRSAVEKGYVGVKPGWTRVSFPYYMSNEEFNFILDAIEFVAIYGQRFLPYYRFSWRTGSWTPRKKAGLKDIIADKENIDSTQALQLSCHSGAISIEHGNSKECNNERGKPAAEVDSKYASYLELAIHIANMLPKSPPHRKLPQDIDTDLLYFRV